MEIELDTSKSAAKNASLLFSKAKKLDEKVKKAQEAIAALEQKRDNLKEVKLEVTDVLKIKKEREWYEKFRWFISSEGFLVIGGRDATTNEIIVKKHADKNDLVFHTDMVGSPFFVIKSDNKKIGEATIKEPNEIDKIEWMTFNDFFNKFSDDEIGHGLVWLRKNPHLWNTL